MRDTLRCMPDRPQNGTDPLTGVLTLLDLRCALSSRFEAGGRWALRFRTYRHAKVGAVLTGSCWLTADGVPPLRLQAGDCYLLAGGRPYEIAGDLGTEPVDGHAVFERAASTSVRYGEPHGADRTVLIGGAVEFDDATGTLLLDSLPPTYRIGAQSAPAHVVRPMLRMLADEAAASRPGAVGMAENLTEILFIQALRALLTDEGDGQAVSGWLGALNDPQIGVALALMHRQAGRRWTVADLASEVGMSRSAFAARFRAMVGLPPLEYLMHWRIRAAGRTLRDGRRTVASVAAEWGYASESAFSNAFKRITGQPPARYRAQAR